MDGAVFQVRALYVQSQAGVEGVEAQVRCAVQILSLCIESLVERIIVDNTVGRLLVGTAVVKYVSSYLSVKVIAEVLFLCFCTG